MKIINMFSIGTPPPQPLLQEEILIIPITERNQTNSYGKKENRLCLFDSNPEHVYYFYEQDDIKLI